MHDLAMETMTGAQHEGLTTAQDKVLSIVPIPSAILSIFGSSVILYMAISTRRLRKWTTYTRLLIGLSMCDIISSVSLAFAAFMRRPESGRIWAIGNDATCAAIGTMTQFSYSNIFYNAMLSYYFLATVRFQMKHSRIARLLEPWMHFVSIGYPLVTSVVGAAYGMYGEKATGMGCWVNEYPRGCGDDPGQEPCTSGLIGWLYLGLPLLLNGFSILVNNLIIGCHVWAHTKTSTHHSRTAPPDTLSTSTSSDFATKMDRVTEKQELALNNHQLRRLRLVSSQAFLFVASYAVCTLSLGTLGILEAITQEENEPQLMQNLYWLMVLNAILAPLQGFLNMLVYIRPKYLKNRQDFPLETKSWAIRRAIFGDRVKAHRFINVEEKRGDEVHQSAEPTKAEVIVGASPDDDGKMKDVESGERSFRSLPKDKVVSSITLSNWDHFDLDESEFSEDLLVRQNERWADRAVGDVSNAAPTARRQSQSQINFHSSISSLGISLPFIAETELLDMEDDTSSHSFDYDGGVVVVSTKQSSEARWGSTTADGGKASQNLDGFNNNSRQLLSTSNHTKSSTGSSARLVAPIRVASEHDELATAKMWAASLGFQIPPSSNPNDSPLIAPKRLPSDCELVDDTGDNKIVVNRSSLEAPKRRPSNHHDVVVKVEGDDDDDKKTNVKRSSLKAPQRLPSDHGMAKVETRNTRQPAIKRSSPSLKVPQRLPSDQDMIKVVVRATTTSTEEKVPPPPPISTRSPNNRSPSHLSPVAPRRVPTSFDDDDSTDEFMLE